MSAPRRTAARAGGSAGAAVDRLQREHGCRRVAPAASAASARSVSRCSRPRARPQRCVDPSPPGSAATIVSSPRISATRRSSAPASRSNSAPMPSASRSGRLLAAMHSPQTLRRGKRCFSIRATDQPACASRIAAVEPAGPAPTTATSNSRFMASGPRARAEAMREQAVVVFVEPPRGRLACQAAPSSWSTKPARTLSTPSWRVTALAPRKKMRWLAPSAKRLRRGSQATSPSARRAQPASKRPAHRHRSDGGTDWRRRRSQCSPSSAAAQSITSASSGRACQPARA